MCGLSGYITHKDKKLTPKQKLQRDGVIKGLLLAMQERGTHSSGVGIVCKKEFCIYKKAKSARELIAEKDFDVVLGWKPNILIGHTRFATIGEVTDENAHPFEIGRIMGAHNGHVTNYRDVMPDAEVDSQAIFHALNEEKNDYKKAMARLKGQFAITWVNLDDLTKVYLLKGDNPLCIVKVNEIQTYFWASTYYALQSVVGSVFDITNKTIWSPKDNHVYEISTNFQIKKHLIEFMPSAMYGGGYDASKYTYAGKTVGKNDCLSPGNCSLHDKKDEVKQLISGTSQDKIVVGEVCDDIDEEEGDFPVNDDDILKSLTRQEVQTIGSELECKCAYCGQDFDMLNDEVFYWNASTENAICIQCGDTEDLWEECLVFSFDKLLYTMAENDYQDELNQIEEGLSQ